MKYEAPFDERFRDSMVKVTAYLMDCGVNIIYGTTESDEISLLFSRSDATFGRKVRKINSTLAGEASAVFSLDVGQIATFDCRVVPLPNIERVCDYFSWRQADAHRNALNSYCYWTLRKEGKSVREATNMLSGKGDSYKNELLFQRGINYNDLPAWQKRGVGLYKKSIQTGGYNPITNEKISVTRNKIFVDYKIPFGEEYRSFILNLVEENKNV